MKSPRYWSVVVLLVIAAAMLYRRGDKDRVPPSTPLSEFPETIGPWNGTDLSISQETLDVLGHGFFLNRSYMPTPGAMKAAQGAGVVGLFIGYFPTQRSGQSIHSPQNCLPGSGWVFESSGVTEVSAGGKTDQVGDYIIANGTNRAEVLYWYQSHGRAVASDYRAKLDLLADSIRYNRSDAALVRIVSPYLNGESHEQAHRRAVVFAEHLIPLLPAYIPD